MPCTTKREHGRGDVVLVPFLFTDQTRTKHRPAVVVSSEAYNAGRDEIVIAAMTSRARHSLLVGDSRLRDWRACGLVKPSVVTAILWTVRSSMVRRTIGRLSDRDVRAVDRSLARALGV